MRTVLRNDWMEWCDDLTRGAHGHFETVGDRHGVVRLLDYAPFEDVLELDVETSGALDRRLIEHPVRIWVETHPPVGTVVIEASDETVLLVAFDVPPQTWEVGRRPALEESTEEQRLPESMRGSYFHG